MRRHNCRRQSENPASSGAPPRGVMLTRRAEPLLLANFSLNTCSDLVVSCIADKMVYAHISVLINSTHLLGVRTRVFAISSTYVARVMRSNGALGHSSASRPALREMGPKPQRPRSPARGLCGPRDRPAAFGRIIPALSCGLRSNNFGQRLVTRVLFLSLTCGNPAALFGQTNQLSVSG